MRIVIDIADISEILNYHIQDNKYEGRELEDQLFKDICQRGDVYNEPEK